MKPTIKAGVFGGIVGAVLTVVMTSFATGPLAAAADSDTRETYRVVRLGDLEKGGFEQGLNRFARDGWKVKTTLGEYIVLFK